jgi:hypothetical protein
MDKAIRNAIEQATQQGRKLLDEDFSSQLEGTFDVLRSGGIGAKAGAHLSALQQSQRDRIVAAIEHKRAAGMTDLEAVADYVRDAAFTTLNRFVALKMLEARQLVQECVTKGEQSAGYRVFCGMAPGLPLLPDGAGYRLYIESLFDELSTEVKVLFDRRDSSSVLWPKRTTFERLLDILNDTELSSVWGEDETIGWVYQFFNGQDERRKMREESPAPRNSRELAIRNQFFTPRYVVQFLTDNTLGRLWYEMRGTKTFLAELCEYMVRNPGEDFAPRAKKDPRDLRIIDPACGSGHFLLYAFDLLLAIYEEAHADPESPNSNVTGRTLAGDYPTLDALRSAMPGLILANNLHGVDIDPRCAQIAQLALWMRAQKAHRAFGIGRAERPQIRRSNIVVAEPLVADGQIAKEFVAKLDDVELGRIFTSLVQSLNLAGDLGLLLRVEQLVARPTMRGQTSDLFAPSEEQIRAALERYVTEEGGRENARRRLFADDAAHGLELLRLAEQKYDVVLMNPPFGAMPTSMLPYITENYPESRNDIYACFVARAAELLDGLGQIGQITSSTCLTLDHLSDWRQQFFFGRTRLGVLADLGSGVLDGATVKTAAYVLKAAAGADDLILCADARNYSDRADGLSRVSDPSVWRAISRAALLSLPGAPVAYSLPSYAGSLIASGNTVEGAEMEVNVGMMSGDDFRYLRAWWELPVGHAGAWSVYEKGNGYKRFICDPVLHVRSERGFHEAGADVANKYGSASRFIMNRDKYCRPGLVYTRITNKGFSVRLLPPGQVFSGAGLAIFPPHHEWNNFTLAGLLNSRFFECSLRALSDGRKWEAGYVRKGPLPVNSKDDSQMAASVREALEVVLEALSFDETTRYFSRAPIQESTESVRNALDVRFRRALLSIDRRAAAIFQVGDVDARDVDALVGGFDSWVARESLLDTTIEAKQRWRIYLLGCVFGRWMQPKESVRPTTVDEILARGLAITPPLAAAISKAVDVLVDDPGDSADIAAELSRCADQHQQAFHETEARMWCRSEAFQAHVRQYSDGHRKAPIYWQLATPTASYSVWLYIHAFSKDTLFRVQNDYAARKVAHEERRLESLANELSGGATAAQRKDLAEQENLVEELRAFLEEVKHVAPLWNPNLDDGVIINFAPLWRLVPQNKSWQKELKSTWQELCDGKYDWAHLAMHFWPERVIPKCATDRSLAIAHGLEDVFWAEDAKGKWKPRPTPTRSVAELVRERTSIAVKAALKSLLEAPVANANSGRGRGRRFANAAADRGAR